MNRTFSNSIEILDEACTVYCSDGQRYYLPKKHTIKTSLKPKILPKSIIHYPNFEFEPKPELYEPVDYFSENDFPIYLILILTIISLIVILAFAFRFLKSKVKQLKGVPLI